MSRHRLPVIRRARSFWLYGFDGTRYLDLWQHDGRAYYGHNPKGMSVDLKNRLSPSLYSPLPHPIFDKVLKLARKVFPGYTPLLFPSTTSLSSFLVEKGFPALPPNPWSVLEWTDSLAEHVQLLRPDRPADPGSSRTYLLPLLPVPADFGTVLLLSPEHEQTLIAQSSPLQLTALMWGLKLWAAGGTGAGAPEIPGQFPEAFRFFRRDGRYLIPHATEEEYFGLFKYARGRGVILNPLHGGISILPPTTTPGEWKKILDVLEGFHGS